MTRRDLVKLLLTAAAFLSGRRVTATSLGRAAPAEASATPMARRWRGFRRAVEQPFEPEYIVVGSGAGGGTVAARLAEAGFRVLVLEAGGDPRKLSGANPLSNGANTLPEDYDVPGFHPLSTENDALRWDFFVRHYSDQAQQIRDRKYVDVHEGKRVDGVWYPRAGTLGGCTAHNAMIFVAPPNADWDQIADLTGDASWRGEKMWEYFRRIEDCRYRPFQRLLAKFGSNPSRHGWSGWLTTQHAVPIAAILDRNVRDVFVKSARKMLDMLEPVLGGGLKWLGEADPNDWRVVRDSTPGLRFTPTTTKDFVRVGSRERLLDVQARFPDRLKIELNALATKVIFDDRKRAIGVEYLKGEHLYRADPKGGAEGVLTRAMASREVILAGGAFNTPQLLMLSGVGDPAELARHNIATLVDLPGVGTRLQDRYEVSVISRMAFPSWDLLKGATFLKGDKQFQAWETKKDGVYTTNGALVSVVLPSRPGRPVPDLFCYGVLTKFEGYKPGYSKLLPTSPNYLSWVVLKGRTNNTGGTVTLNSGDARDLPKINFRYFEEGTDATGDDLQSVVEGVKFVRGLTANLGKELVETEEQPGASVDTDEKLRTYVRDNAWGHHASCTCRIGSRDDGGVLSSDFKVHGTEGLRVVDASVFPRVPGLFIVAAIYMIGEKAADVIVAQSGAKAAARAGAGTSQG